MSFTAIVLLGNCVSYFVLLANPSLDLDTQVRPLFLYYYYLAKLRRFLVLWLQTLLSKQIWTFITVIST